MRTSWFGGTLGAVSTQFKLSWLRSATTELMSSTNPTIALADSHNSLSKLLLSRRRYLSKKPRSSIKLWQLLWGPRIRPSQKLHESSRGSRQAVDMLSAIPAFLLISRTRRFNVWCSFHSWRPWLGRYLYEIAAIPVISCTTNSTIHYYSCGMQDAFFSWKHVVTGRRCFSSRMVMLTILSQRVMQMRGH